MITRRVLHNGTAVLHEAAASFHEPILLSKTSPALASHDSSRTDPLETHWGFGKNENLFNQIIICAVEERWGSQKPQLPPLLMKSVIAQESSFNPNAVSPTDHVGLTQLGREEALAEGLKLEPVDERFIPEKNVRAGVGVLSGKKEGILHPEELIDRYPFAQKVVEAYARYGQPQGKRFWTLALASYNGGVGTIFRAMAEAFDRSLDPTIWNNLVEPRKQPEQSPLYAATLEVFGPQRALAKYYEIGRYPLEILLRAPVASVMPGGWAGEQATVPAVGPFAGPVVGPVALVGPPGSGKSTQGKLLSQKLGVPFISAGDLLRKEVEEGTPLGKVIQPIIERGDLAPVWAVKKIIHERIAQPDTRDGVILDGYPRNLEQARLLDDFLPEMGWEKVRVIEIKVPREEILKRLAGRGRRDDTPEVIRERLQVYERETAPLLRHYRSLGQLDTIDGAGTVEEVHGRMLDAIEDGPVIAKGAGEASPSS